jgi:hypothetical protein
MTVVAKWLVGIAALIGGAYLAFWVGYYLVFGASWAVSWALFS